MISSHQTSAKANRQVCRDTFPRNRARPVMQKIDTFSRASVQGVGKELGRFLPWNLEEMADIRLFNRVDTKFLMPATILPELLFGLHPLYRILEIGDARVFDYQNLYFDTPEFRFFANHHNGKLERHKVRYRSYGATGRTFLEVKIKPNTKRTIKTRHTSCGFDANMTERDRLFLKRKLPSGDTHLVPSLFGRYLRISLADSEKTERVTLDFNLAFGANGKKTKAVLNGVLVAELKQSRVTQASPFLRFMRQWGFRPTSFSKYCMGCCMTYPGQLKINNFKPQLLLLKKVQESAGCVGGTS